MCKRFAQGGWTKEAGPAFKEGNSKKCSLFFSLGIFTGVQIFSPVCKYYNSHAHPSTLHRVRVPEATISLKLYSMYAAKYSFYRFSR